MNLGIIGLGEVAQMMHLPVLSDMWDVCRITAVSDISTELVEHIKARYGIPYGTTDAYELIRREDVDAVLVLCPDQYHGPYVKSAIEIGKHVFVEKPAALSIKELSALIEVHGKNPDIIVMVGYMRRYASNFLLASEMLKSGGRKTEYLRFRDIILEAEYYRGQSRKTFVPKDIPQKTIIESRLQRINCLNLALGQKATEVERTVYQKLTGLGCHSLSAVRELFGIPRKVVSVTASEDGTHLVITFEFDGFIAIYELVNDQKVVQFDASVEIFQKNRKILIKYDTPHIRNLPLDLQVIDSTPKDTKTTVFGPIYTDPFRTEMELFLESIRTGVQPKTSLEDSLEDLRLFQMIMKRYRREKCSK